MGQGHQCGGCGTKGQHDCGCKSSKKKTMTIQVDGMEVPCYVLCVFQCEEKSYIGLQNKDSDRIYLYIYQEEDDQIRLEEITDQEELRTAGRLLIEELS